VVCMRVLLGEGSAFRFLPHYSTPNPAPSRCSPLTCKSAIKADSPPTNRPLSTYLYV